MRTAARNKGLWSFFAAGSAISLLLSACALSPVQKEKTESDWKLASSIRGSGASPLHRKLFGNAPLDGNLYRRFFDQRVTRIEGEGWGYASCHGAFACSTGQGTIRLSESYGKLDVPAIIRLSFLIHEARHAEGWEHETCPKTAPTSPFQHIALAGTRECDASELGANGVQIVMLKNVAKYCTNCDTALRQEADAYGNFLLQLIDDENARKSLAADFSN